MFSTLYSTSFLFVVLFSEVGFVEEKMKLKRKQSSFIEIIFHIHKQNPFTKEQFLGKIKTKKPSKQPYFN